MLKMLFDSSDDWSDFEDFPRPSSSDSSSKTVCLSANEKGCCFPTQ